jgi:hypothetical protein
VLLAIRRFGTGTAFCGCQGDFGVLVVGFGVLGETGEYCHSCFGWVLSFGVIAASGECCFGCCCFGWLLLRVVVASGGCCFGWLLLRVVVALSSGVDRYRL